MRRRQQTERKAELLGHRLQVLVGYVITQHLARAAHFQKITRPIIDGVYRGADGNPEDGVAVERQRRHARQARQCLRADAVQRDAKALHRQRHSATRGHSESSDAVGCLRHFASLGHHAMALDPDDAPVLDGQ
ncbi:hypothetical protein SDC9_193989 [bioreactor metagenome]|uniref:Uncharacterized protein n=1 Tax=bioreactor metagenome TaxID=1076179 RepID=A0A645IGB7_9ZZZZ